MLEYKASLITVKKVKRSKDWLILVFAVKFIKNIQPISVGV